jgi:hypothetical protein
MKNLPLIILSLVLLSQQHVFASDIPGQMPFQGFLTTADGTPVDDISMPMIFTLYDKAKGGTSLWSEELEVTAKEGIINVILGTKTAINPALFKGDKLYVEVTIEGEVMDNRLEILPTGYAYTAQTALNVPDKDDILGMVDDGGYVKGGKCTGDQILKWKDGTGWECSEDAGGVVYGEGKGIDIDGSNKINVVFGTAANTASEGNHDHDAVYSKTGHNHDDLYFTETEVTTKLGQYAPAAHNHDSAYAALSHNHDSVYSKTGHNHDGVYLKTGAADIVSSEMIINGAVNTDDIANNAITGDKIKDGTITLADIGKNGCDNGQVLKWSDTALTPTWKCDNDNGQVYNGSTSINISGSSITAIFGTAAGTVAEGNHNHGAIYAPASHNHDSTYSKTSHNHDSSYYLKTDIDTKLGNYSLTSHNHDSTYAKLSHNHNDLYYTETEIDTKLGSYSLTTHSHEGTYAKLSHGHSGSDITDGTITNAKLSPGSFTNITGIGELSSLTVTNNTDIPAIKATGRSIFNQGLYSGILGVGTTPSWGLDVDAEIVLIDNDLSIRSNGAHRWRLRDTSSSTGFQFYQVYNDSGTGVSKTRFEVTDGGDIFVNTAGNGLILRSSNGTCQKLYLNASGVVTWGTVTCP